MPREYVFKDHEAKLAERAVTLRMDDGQVFTILPPQLWSDEVAKVAATDPIAAAAAVLDGGQEAYAAYKAAGGKALILADIVEDAFGTTLPE